MSRKYVLVTAGVVISAIAVAQSVINTPPPPPTPLPPVTVTGTRIGGGTVLCRGDGCGAVLDQMKFEINQEFLDQGLPIQDDPPVNGQQFCNNLRDQKPSGCSASSPPPSPGISIPGQAAWQPNGCGTGGIANWFVDAVLGVTSSQSYSGELDAPWEGVNFRGACDSHDQCWAIGGARSVCDLEFRDSMNTACGQLSDPNAMATCTGFASTYHGAVSTTNASHSAYANSTGDRTCAIWASDMRENNCGN